MANFTCARDNQLNNLELAAEYMVQLHYEYCWVFKYPMEENQKWADEGERTYDNAKSINDKYGYIYIDPYDKRYTGYITAESWGDLEWPRWDGPDSPIGR